jgi:hypothetical protein
VEVLHGEIQFKAADVEMACQNLEEGYQRKRSAIQADNLHDHLEMAQWCQRQKLFDHAAAELAEAAAIAPNHPMVELIGRQLEWAKTPPPDPIKKDSPRETAAINDDLDRLVRGLPPKTIEHFTQSVQPLLLNSCAGSGCHGPTSTTAFRLERIPQGDSGGRRLTQRNLAAVMEYVDRANPAASRLLTIPTSPHGAGKTPIFSERQSAQLKRLADWVMELGPADEPVQAASFSETVKPGEKSKEASDNELPRSKVKRGAPPPEFTPKDSFDPEIFNRRRVAKAASAKPDEKP